MLDINQVYLGDCLEVMKNIDDKSIDMILCDLPYGTTACKWDVVIPLEPLWAHYKRVIKPSGAIVLTASQPFTTMLINTGGLDWFKYELVWDKGRGTQPQLANIQPMKAHENILVFGQRKLTYNPQKEKLAIPDSRKASNRKHNNLKGNGLNILSSAK